VRLDPAHALSRQTIRVRSVRPPERAELAAFVGFAIGRSSWEAVIRHNSLSLSALDAAAEIAERYLSFTRHWTV
jgi:hypothetical protein